MCYHDDCRKPPVATCHYQNLVGTDVRQRLCIVHAKEHEAAGHPVEWDVGEER